MAAAGFKVEFPRRQAMLSIRERQEVDRPEITFKPIFEYAEVARVPVFVWPIPTQDGCFIVEHQDGHCQKVHPYELTFLGSKELFDQHDWSEA